MSKTRYGTVDSGLWKHPAFKTLGEDEKLCFLYLRTCEHNNIIGCFYMPVFYICADLGWNENRVRETLSKLFANGFATVDYDCEMVFLPKHLDKLPLQNKNQGIGAQKLFEEIPRKFKFRKELADKLLTQKQTLPEPFAKGLETLTNSVTVTVTETVTETTHTPSDNGGEDVCVLEEKERWTNPESGKKVQKVFDGLRLRMNLKTLSREEAWRKAIVWGLTNDYTPEEILECYDLLNDQHWREGPVSPKNIESNLPHLEKLRNGKDKRSNSKNQKAIEESREFYAGYDEDPEG